PSVLPAFRAGAEMLVSARMTEDVVKGDVVLRGKVGGERFEARYPIDLRATTGAGNGFVPRLFAAAPIEELERTTSDAANGAARAELVRLSRQFAVPSRATSLLVLESEAMFRAFGIDRAERAASWTGDDAAKGESVASPRMAPSSDGDSLGDPS